MIYKTSLINPRTILSASPADFNQTAISLFYYQYAQNPLYRDFCDALRIVPERVRHITQIPFLPVSFYKSHRVLAAPDDLCDLLFESSGTTGEIPSRHFVYDARVYEQSLIDGFTTFYGLPQQYAILALLPSYLERQNASLVYMARTLMAHSGHPENGFYINEWNKLYDVLQELESRGQKTLLIGVTFALLDFAAAFPGALRHTIVMETGGMKGRKKEMTREEVHQLLKDDFRLSAIHSEYGMTELLSQAYAAADGIFWCAPTMKVMVRDINDPLDVQEHGTGCLNVIDLANMYSCPFIATEDIGTIEEDGSFRVIGRADHSALRGCSLMAV